jgi:protein-tyrosine-phosphatase
MNELYPGKNMDVPDPWSGPEEGYHRAFDMINAACEAIVRHASGNAAQGATGKTSLHLK